MAERLSLVFRALIYQADRHPGEASIAELPHHLHVRVTRSTETENYKLECGHDKHYSDEQELLRISGNWPCAIETPVKWTTVALDHPEDVHWMRAIMKPIKQEASSEQV